MTYICCFILKTSRKWYIWFNRTRTRVLSDFLRQYIWTMYSMVRM